ncbi:MAG: hypothetical protein IJT98_11315 [Prevotella sp.]|nr:hypothetical protein [Prevotella sp.]
MKKLTKLLLTAALLLAGVGGANATKLYATYGTPASEGAWDAETSTYSWTGSSNNLMPIFNFSGGELANYKSLHLTTSEYVDGPYRVCFMNGSTAVATIAFYSAGQKDLVLSERSETKDIDLSQITHISFGGASGAGSVKIVGTPYLQKPTTVKFDETGVAIIGLTDINYDSNLTFNDQTGEMTSNGQGTFSVTLDNEDFSSVTKVELLRSGDDIVQTLQITDADNGVLNTWYSSKYVLDFTSQQAKASKITKLAWNCNTAGTMTITGIRITGSVITAKYAVEAPAGTTDVMNLTGTETNWANSVTYPKEFAVQGASFGNGDGSSESTHVDINGYDYLHLVVSEAQSSSVALRVWIWDDVNNKVVTLYAYPMADYASVTNWETENRITAPGIYVVKVSGYKHLKGVKAANNWGAPSVTVAMAYMSAGAAPVAFEESHKYLLAGKGLVTSSVENALNDATATCFDATGLTATGIELTSANPNALFIANAGALTNANNVIVDGTCANLVLTDGYAFKAPANFTATAAQYTTTINATAKAGTLCLPFAATIPSDVEAYTLTYTSGDAATATPVETTILANTPVLLNGSGEVTFSGSGAVSASATNVSGAMTGVFEATTVPTGSYVLQNGGSGVGFYKVNSSDITAAPFRAYVTATAGARLNIIFAGETTGISSLDNSAISQSGNCIYDLQGRQMSNGQMQRGLYIVNGKKIMVK